MTLKCPDCKRDQDDCICASRESATEVREQVEKLKAELKSIDGALDDLRANLTLTTSEIIWELKDKLEKLTEENVVLRASSRSKLETISSLELQVENLRKGQETLAEAIVNAAIKVRIIAPDTALTGPHLLMLCNDLASSKSEQLLALAEQNAKMREALIAISIAWSSNEIYSQHFFNEALSLPDLASHMLNRIKAEILDAFKVELMHLVANGEASISETSVAINALEARIDKLTNKEKGETK